MTLEVRLRIILLLLCAFWVGFATAKPLTITNISFIAKNNKIPNVAMNPGDETTITWTFSEPVKQFHY